MEREVLISVVVPAYNAEKFLDRAVQSVLCQMDGTVELILVNDGSADGTGDLCDSYAAESSAVKVVHKTNGGLSSARNSGVAAAQGSYILFLDADDYLDKETCTVLSKVICECHPDFIDFGWKYVSQSGEITPNHHKVEKNALLGVEMIKDVILPPLLNLRHDPDYFIYDFACTKAFRKDIIQKNGVVFDESRRIWEDRPFVVEYLRYCRSFYSMEQCFYNYVAMPGSLSTKYSMDFFRIIIENFRLYKKLYGEEYNFDTEYVNGYWCRAIENMIYRSLEQTEHQAKIRKNILEALADKQVVHWYAKREPENGFEREMSRLVAAGAYNEALSGYERKQKEQTRKHTMEMFARKVKRVAKKLIGR